MIRRGSGDQKRTSGGKINLENLENTMSFNVAEAFSVIGRKNNSVKR